MSAADIAAQTGARLRLHNRVLPTLAIVAAAAGLGSGFVTLAPNRLVSGMPVMAWHAASPAACAILLATGFLLLALGFAPSRRALHYVAAMTAGGALAATLVAAGSAATALAVGAPATVAISLGAGFWVIVACAALAMIDAVQRAQAGAAVQLSIAALVVVGFAIMAKAGVFDALSLAREYASRREVFA
ncbi:MAG TPA: ABC transporter permease, partial [Stellaceae bacterium]|nr:ABC transporter permease [Stellaceae bacterium]